MTVTGGRTTWAAARAGDLAGTTCLWQDLDGVHISEAPEESPLTSILWAWAPDGTMYRLRLDNSTVYLARCPATSRCTVVYPWAPDDGRIHAVRGPVQDVFRRLEQIVLDGIVAGAGPITFFRPVQ